MTREPLSSDEPPSYLLTARYLLLAAIHVASFIAIYAAAYWLRFDFAVPSHMKRLFWDSLMWVLGLKLGIFYLAGNYHGWWRYVTFADLAALLRASTIAFGAIVCIDYMLISDDQIPRSIVLLDWLMTILVMGGLRSCIRLSREHIMPLGRKNTHVRALYVGAGEHGAVLASHFQTDRQIPIRIVGFIDADRRKWGTSLGGIKVLGGLQELERLAERHEAANVLISSGTLTGREMRDLVQRCEAAELHLMVMPQLDNLLQSNAKISVRHVDIEDLLQRDPVQLDSASIAAILKGKSVMVTGAGGSIGSEICRQVLKFDPNSLVLVEQAENSLFHIDRELRSFKTTTTLHPRIADILDRERMESLFRHFRPDIVFHAAAHKHVPMMELNVGEAIKNNVLGTKQVADLAHEYGAERFVFISTDKAVNPTSIMGVSKHLAERYVHAMSQESATRFVAVRFGNVLGSAGSVVPIFQEQIRRGGPITVTDPRMTRYFMTIPEASQLVLQASAMGRGGEIFVLDMGEPVRIVDLARDLIRLSGLPADSIEIEFTGMRPGEKLYEELYFGDEETLPTKHEKLRAAYHRPFSKDEVAQTITDLISMLNKSNDALRSYLRIVVPEYHEGGAAAPAQSGTQVTSLVKE